jgi:hypothetical protein
VAEELAGRGVAPLVWEKEYFEPAGTKAKKTGGVLGLVGDRFKHQHGPMAPGLYQVPYANCYRCPFEATYPAWGLVPHHHSSPPVQVPPGGVCGG